MRTHFSLAILILSSSIAAQSPAKPYEVQDTYKRVHQITPSIAIHAEDDPIPAGLTPIQRVLAQSKDDRVFDAMANVALEVIVNQNGRVESAKPVSGPPKFYEQAIAIEEHRAFDPIRNDAGEIVRATFTDYVSVYPPERWLASAPSFPSDIDMHTVSISLVRTSCMGSCPAYSVAIDGDGNILFDGLYGVAIPGHHRTHVPEEAVRNLLSNFRSAKFFNALDQYESNWTDNPSQTLTLTVNGIHKQVVDYIGLVVGLPQAIKDLEAEVDKAAATARWVTGNAETLPSLRAEHWNFASASRENIVLYNTAIERQNQLVLQAFVAAKAPFITSLPKLSQPICVASGQGNRDLVTTMLALMRRGFSLPTAIKNRCLAEAARAGNPALVDLWMSKGASVNSTPAPPQSDNDNNPEPGIFPLLDAIASRNPEVVEQLLHAHARVGTADNNHRALVSFALERFDRNEHSEADSMRLRRTVTLLLEAQAPINEETGDDRPALFEISSAPELLLPLINAGADVNQKDQQGETPLMYASDDETIKALLAAGADPTVHATDGKSTIDMVKRWSCKSCVALLEQAIVERTAPAVPANK